MSSFRRQWIRVGYFFSFTLLLHNSVTDDPCNNSKEQLLLIFKVCIYHDSPNMIQLKTNCLLNLKKVKLKFAWIFKRIFTCVSCHRDAIIKTIMSWGRVYVEIRIVHISETGIIVLQFNVQTGNPMVGQMMKIFISCNQKKTCEFQREGESVCGGGEGGVCVRMKSALRQEI